MIQQFDTGYPAVSNWPLDYHVTRNSADDISCLVPDANYAPRPLVVRNQCRLVKNYPIVRVTDYRVRTTKIYCKRASQRRYPENLKLDVYFVWTTAPSSIWQIRQHQWQLDVVYVLLAK